MQSISAISITPAVNGWLANTYQPRILHVFDYVCNLINEHGEVLSVVAPQIGNGPFNIVVEDDNNFTEQLGLESLVSTSRTQITLGDLTIRMPDAKLWNPQPDWEVLHAKRDDITRQLSALPNIDYLKLSGFDTPLDDHSGLLNHQHLPITPISNSLISSLVNTNLASSLKAAQQLAGLGIGLTPAGDDFIMGAILAAWILHPPDVASELAKEITDTVAPLTTSLSAALLKSAGRGEAGQVWHDLFDALISADKMVIQESVDQLLSVGHTSGADALTGFLGVFNSYAEQK